MKFLRHLSAVVLAVAVIVGLGMLWAHAAGGGQVRTREELLRWRQIKAGDSIGGLIEACVIQAMVGAGVIRASARRRRRRRARRPAPGA